MKVCIMSAASLIHTVRWANALAQRGHEIHLITMQKAQRDRLDPRVQVHLLKVPAPFGYYVNRQEAKKLLKEIQPDVLHAHYASGYGTLARLTRFKPVVLSVWGSDVYLFPKRSKLNAKTLTKNLQAASRITSPSRAVKEQIQHFVTPASPIEVIPFGVDADLFRPEPGEAGKAPDTITIGTVKRLEREYGVDTLIKTVAKLMEHLRNDGHAETAAKIRLMIVGDGSERKALEQLAEELHIADVTEFVAAVPNREVPVFLNQFDIYCALSRSESFGVAVLEASTCEVPVLVSDVGGLPEVVQHGKTGFVVNRENKEEIAEHLEQLVLDPALRKQMGERGRIFAKTAFDWNENVSAMERVYEEVVKKR